ncbi:hypothetical protein L9F63_026483, partial [Diploptera punctata]
NCLTLWIGKPLSQQQRFSDDLHCWFHRLMSIVLKKTLDMCSGWKTVSNYATGVIGEAMYCCVEIE